ncbi:MAG TPA: hypothetical protein VF636_06910 [Sphingomonas sp.]|jgi:hypothetical protein
MGQTTGGGGNPSAGMGLESDLVVVVMPIGVMHPVIPGPGWEGVGIAPDLAVPAAEAEARALQAIG